MRGPKDSLNGEVNNFTVFMRNGKEEENEEDKGQAKGEAYLYLRHVVAHAYLIQSYNRCVSVNVSTSNDDCHSLISFEERSFDRKLPWDGYL